ncbi:MAG: RAMP superfamily CRISPR-associated protein [Gloeomargarita sp. SKYBB_i_bin120]|nr:RAMP superfamily CRISPR-associated protein [Gloeomargarita sp. SKYB120]MDW8179263.1 RAMP superfamily CRISPR-associated protein [Gloeomargarita sp. SKYBB_i_bin120]
MYTKACGIIETLAPLHVGASAGEETGNLNLIFRDQFTQTGIIPGSSIRGRFRAEMRREGSPYKGDVNKWYGHEAVEGQADGGTTEALVKFEYASLVWFPVFCPGQPVVWISCPRLLRRYQMITGVEAPLPKPYTADPTLQAKQFSDQKSTRKVLFFNLGFLEIEHEQDMKAWIPKGTSLQPQSLVVVGDNDIGLLHDMGLYRQSRVKLQEDMKKVAGGAFFNVEAIPEGSVFVFPIALKEKGWDPFAGQEQVEMYFGGLESIGFGRCRVTLGGEYC